jgi:hypothetical protein
LPNGLYFVVMETEEGRRCVRKFSVAARPWTVFFNLFFYASKYVSRRIYRAEYQRFSLWVIIVNILKNVILTTQKEEFGHAQTFVFNAWSDAALDTRVRNRWQLFPKRELPAQARV